LLLAAGSAQPACAEASSPDCRQPVPMSRRSDPDLFANARTHPSGGGYAILAKLLADGARPLLPHG